jgi:hypothetical protein
MLSNRDASRRSRGTVMESVANRRDSTARREWLSASSVCREGPGVVSLYTAREPAAEPRPDAHTK